MKQLNEIAENIYLAAAQAEAVEQFADKYDLNEDEAYLVQLMSMKQRYKKGERRVGFKMGLTSTAKMKQVGVDSVIIGTLTDKMYYPNNGTIDIKNFVHPRVEPEIAFILKKDLTAPISAAEAMSAVDAICPAIEIIDSRFKNFKFTLGDVVADNCSSSGYILGEPVSAQSDISNLGIIMQKNGEVVQTGSSAAILGHPARSLAEAATMALKMGQTLNAGDIILAGAATEAVPVFSGDKVTVEIENLGRVHINCN